MNTTNENYYGSDPYDIICPYIIKDAYDFVKTEEDKKRVDEIMEKFVDMVEKFNKKYTVTDCEKDYYEYDEDIYCDELVSTKGSDSEWLI